MERRAYKGALELLRQAQKLEPDSPGIVFNLGMAANYTGDFEQGIAAFRHYRELQPDDPRGLSKLIQAYQGAGLIKQAETTIDDLRTWWREGRLAGAPTWKLQPSSGALSKERSSDRC